MSQKEYRAIHPTKDPIPSFNIGDKVVVKITQRPILLSVLMLYENGDTGRVVEITESRLAILVQMDKPTPINDKRGDCSWWVSAFDLQLQGASNKENLK